MAVIYEQAGPEVHQMAREIFEAHHKDLRVQDGSYPRLCILLASNADADSGEPALKDGKYPAAGAISVIPYKQRVDKRADAEVLLDEGRWNDATEPQQRALLDHLLTHLEVVKDENGFVKTDDSGRPKLQLRLCDWFLKGFRSIAQRYGADAPEVLGARDFEKRFGDVALAGEKLFA